MNKHLVELLTEQQFTTVQVFFETAANKSQAPATGLQYPSSPRSSFAKRRPDLNELTESEFEQLGAAFPFIASALPAKLYTYKCSKDVASELTKGDRVVVPTGENAMAVATVWLVDGAAEIDYNAQFAYRWIVQKVEDQKYRENMQHEADFRKLLVESEKRRQREAIRAAMLQSLVPQDEKSLADFNSALKLLGVPPITAPLANPSNGN
jgi:hypothetical protein